jgi:hypothetical protein
MIDISSTDSPAVIEMDWQPPRAGTEGGHRGGPGHGDQRSPPSGGQMRLQSPG